jgi:hypothetical protein
MTSQWPTLVKVHSYAHTRVPDSFLLPPYAVSLRAGFCSIFCIYVLCGHDEWF